MHREQIIRAWKDEEYRLSLSEAELSALPENPAGFVELSDSELGDIGGQTLLIGCLPTSLLTLTPTVPTFQLTWCGCNEA